jgi:hypothetical protein
MNLQEQISRMQSMMGFINEDKKTDFIYKNFDKVFDNLKLIKTEKNIYQYDWVNENGDVVFARNHWGMFWVYDCNEYKSLTILPIKMLEFSYEQFKEVLINYLNNRYYKEFGEERPLRNIGDDECSHNEDD